MSNIIHNYQKQIDQIYNYNCIFCNINSLIVIATDFDIVQDTGKGFKCRICDADFFVDHLDDGYRGPHLALSINNISLAITKDNEFVLRVGSISSDNFHIWNYIPPFNIQFNKEVLTNKLKTILTFL